MLHIVMFFFTVVHLSCICLFKSKSGSWFQTYDWDGNALLFMVFMMPMFPVPWIEIFTVCDILGPTENCMTGHALAVISGYIYIYIYHDISQQLSWLLIEYPNFGVY